MYVLTKASFIYDQNREKSRMNSNGRRIWEQNIINMKKCIHTRACSRLKDPEALIHTDLTDRLPGTTYTFIQTKIQDSTRQAHKSTIDNKIHP